MKIRSSTGQIAIFVILIFQVLFILFAMAVNIALVTHDKINLQNSLDMATLYGAKKQAEVLNAISHINFQMRQNYKLLAWRYRILGTVSLSMGERSFQGPVFCPGDKGVSKNICTRPSAPGIDNMQATFPGFYDRYFLCTITPLWNSIRGKTNYCQNINFKVTPVPIAKGESLISLTVQFQRFGERLRRNFQQVCNQNTLTNSRLAHIFLSHFRLDQKDRRLMILKIFEKSLRQGNDLDGRPIKEGVLKTFEKNLNYTNAKNFQGRDSLLTFNSFQGRSLDFFLEPIPVFPILNYLKMDEECSGQMTNTLEGGGFRDDSATLQLVELNRTLSTDFSNTLHSLLLGFAPKRKNILYYGASTRISYTQVSQLFIPFIGSKETLTLRASAFSKPFGGKIGPGEEADSHLKNLIKAGKGETGSRILPYLYQPNYSLYPGDPLGLIEKSLHGRYYLKKISRKMSGSLQFYNIEHYSRLFPTAGDNRLPPDALANDFHEEAPQGNPLLPARLMELTAISPDAFDLTYYSILNNYMETYFPRICKLIGEESSECKTNRPHRIEGAGDLMGEVRGDFGYPYTNIYRNNNIQTHKVGVSLSPFFFHYKPSEPRKMNLSTTDSSFYQVDRPPYLIKDPAHALTSWTPSIQKERYDRYHFGQSFFMRCSSPAISKSHFAIPSGCAQGGRSGFSIKLISCEQVRRFPNRPPSLDSFCDEEDD